jgi:hypothetical protein
MAGWKARRPPANRRRRQRMDDRRTEHENPMLSLPTEHAEWREVLRDAQTVREGLDGTSSGDPSPYEALERLKQDVRLGKNSRAWAETSAKQAWAIIRRLLSDFELLLEENERPRKTRE